MHEEVGRSLRAIRAIAVPFCILIGHSSALAVALHLRASRTIALIFLVENVVHR